MTNNTYVHPYQAHIPSACVNVCVTYWICAFEYLLSVCMISKESECRFSQITAAFTSHTSLPERKWCPRYRETSSTNVFTEKCQYLAWRYKYILQHIWLIRVAKSDSYPVFQPCSCESMQIVFSLLASWLEYKTCYRCYCILYSHFKGHTRVPWFWFFIHSITSTPNTIDVVFAFVTGKNTFGH